MKKAKQQQQIRSPVHNENEPDISNEENESYLEGKIQLPTQMFLLRAFCDKRNGHMCRRGQVKY